MEYLRDYQSGGAFNTKYAMTDKNFQNFLEMRGVSEAQYDGATKENKEALYGMFVSASLAARKNKPQESVSLAARNKPQEVVKLDEFEVKMNKHLTYLDGVRKYYLDMASKIDSAGDYANADLMKQLEHFSYSKDGYEFFKQFPPFYNEFITHEKYLGHAVLKMLESIDMAIKNVQGRLQQHKAMKQRMMSTGMSGGRRGYTFMHQ